MKKILLILTVLAALPAQAYSAEKYFCMYKNSPFEARLEGDDLIVKNVYVDSQKGVLEEANQKQDFSVTTNNKQALVMTNTSFHPKDKKNPEKPSFTVTVFMLDKVTLKSTIASVGISYQPLNKSLYSYGTCSKEKVKHSK